MESFFLFSFSLAPEVETPSRPPKTQSPSKMAKAITELCSDLGLLDTWRITNPKEKDFTFFSNPHNSLSRIDYIFVSR